MIHIYTPRNRYEVHDPGDQDFAFFEEVEEFLRVEGEQVRDLVALVVLEDGRVFYHYRASREMAFNFDGLEGVGQRWVPIFERLIEDNKLEIVALESEYAPFVWDISLAHTPALPPGAQLWGKGGAA